MPVETAYPQALLSKVLSSAAPVILLTKDNWLDNLPEEWKNSDSLFIFDDNWQDKLSAKTLPALDHLEKKLTSDSLAYCVMSSGTTGTPKGITCPHRGAVNSYYWRYTHYPYQQGERDACNVFFVWEVLRPLLRGVPAYVIPDQIIYDPCRLVEFLNEHRITRVLFTPSLLEQLLNTKGIDLEQQLKHLDIVWVNGEVVTTALVGEFVSRLPGTRLINDYSISECHDVCTHELSNLDLQSITTKFAPVGPPMDNVRIYILDDLLRPVPVGVRGEIYVAGETLARGYLNSPQTTAERFLQDPIRDDGSKMYRTGDVGKVLSNGHLEVQGRTEFMIKLRGYSIVLGAVEAAIAEHPGVNRVVVMAENNTETEQPEYLVAYVVCKKNKPDSDMESVLRDHAKNRLPQYSIPSLFIFLDTLPLHDVTGKLDRKRLPRPRDVFSTLNKESHHRESITEREKTIITIWGEVLPCKPRSLSDNFFDLGGHSLLAIEMVAKVSSTLQVKLSVVDVYHHSTVRSFASYVADITCKRENRLGGIIDDVFRHTKPFNKQSHGDSEIAIIGLAGRFPGAENISTFWENLCKGVRSIRPLSIDQLLSNGISREVFEDEDYIRSGALLDDVDQFDPEFWGISKSEASMMDPQHRIFLECCWEAIENAGYAVTQIGRRTGIFGGCFLPTYLLNVLGGGGLSDSTDPAGFHITEISNDKDYLSSRVAYLLGLRGPAVTIQTSCSTALTAVASACQSIMTGQCDTALAGASSITFPQAGYQYAEGYINSKDAHVRTFDAHANGSVLGDGVGIVLLKKHQHALADGDRILSVIKGFGINNDGRMKAGYSAPSVQGQAEVIAQALASADIPPETLSYVEAHGTGTLIGDPIEVQALTEVFRRTTDKKGFCGLGSVKPNIGHSNIAAGMAGLIKTVLSLHHKVIPPTIEFTTPNPELKLQDSPFYINDSLKKWDRNEDFPRRAGVSCFGIGGTNVHCVLEEAKKRAKPVVQINVKKQTATIIPLSAKTTGSLEGNRKQLVDYLKNNPDIKIRDIGYTLSVGRENFPNRLAVACNDHQSAIEALQAWKKPTSLMAEASSGVVFMFPGQGSQYCGMGKELYESEHVFKQHADACCELVTPLIGENLKTLLFTTSPETETEKLLQQPHILQPALFTIEYSLAKTLMHLGIEPDYVVGHSIGEYVAACLAGIMNLKDTMTLVMVRATAIDNAPEGHMLSVQMTEAEARDFINSKIELTLAVVNSVRDCVLSGPPDAIAEAVRECDKLGYVSTRVQVNRPFHSHLLRDAARVLDEKAEAVSLHPPIIPMTSNLTGKFISDNEAVDPKYWGRQMCSKVQFKENIETILNTSPAVILEVGPGRVLSTLVKRIVHNASYSGKGLLGLSSLPHPLDKETTELTFFRKSLATLWQHGLNINWDALYTGEQRARVELPTYCFEKIRCWPKDTFQLGAIAPTVADIEGINSSQGFFYFPSWAQTLPIIPKRKGLSPSGSSKCWLIFIKRSGPARILGKKLCHQLKQDGHRVIQVISSEQMGGLRLEKNDVFQIDPENLSHYRELFQKLMDRGSTPDNIIHFWSVTNRCMTTQGQALSHYFQWITFAQALIDVPIKTLKVWTVTNHVFQVNQETISPIKTTLLGPVLVLSQENPHINSRLLDIQMPKMEILGDMLNTLTSAILAETTCEKHESETFIALRGNRRWVQRFEEMQCDQSVSHAPLNIIRSNNTYIITGGLGRIGMELAAYLAEKKCNLILIGRNTFPKKEHWDKVLDENHIDSTTKRVIRKLLTFEEKGASVFVKQADVGDAEGIQRVLEETYEHFGVIHGIFHAAGVANLHYLQELASDISKQEFISKIDGVLNLEKAIKICAQKTKKQPLFTVLFSSMASILGGLGMAAYSAANRFMDAFSQSKSFEQGMQWLCINWDDWDFKYTKEQIAAYDKNIAQYAIAPKNGIQILERLLKHENTAQLLVSSRPLKPRVEQWLHQRNLADGEEKICKHEVTKESEIMDDNLIMLEEEIAAVYKESLGVVTLSADDDFFEMGGDSLLAARILMRIRRTVAGGEKLHLTSIFEYPTVKQLAESMTKQIQSEEDAFKGGLLKESQYCINL